MKKRYNPVHKFSEIGETRNRPKTIESKRDKLKKGKTKYPKQDLLRKVDEYENWTE